MKLNIEELIRQSNETAKQALDGSLHEGFDRERMKAFASLIVERCAQEATKNANVFPDDGQATAGVIHSAIRNLMED